MSDSAPYGSYKEDPVSPRNRLNYFFGLDTGPQPGPFYVDEELYDRVAALQLFVRLGYDSVHVNPGNLKRILDVVGEELILLEKKPEIKLADDRKTIQTAIGKLWNDIHNLYSLPYNHQ